MAVEEYRFQVDLNWRRSEYFFVLNVGVLIAAATLLTANDIPRGLVALVFGVGALLAVLTVLANETQHGYYQAAREVKTGLEAELGISDHALATTPAMGSRIKRLGRVGTFLRVMLIGLAVVDAIGVGISIQQARDTKNSPVRVAFKPRFSGARNPAPATLVVSRGSKVTVSRTIKDRGVTPAIALVPGRYVVSLLRREICTRRV